MKIEIDITDQMEEILEFVRHQSEIELSVGDMTELLSRDVQLVVDISEWGWADTEVKSRIIGLVTDRFLGRRWPTYGENIDVRSFIDELRAAAIAEGFRTLPRPETADAERTAPRTPHATARQVHPAFSTERTRMTAVEVWAFTTNEVDVQLRSAVYGSLEGKAARLALAKLFPEGTSCEEVRNRASRLHQVSPGMADQGVLKAVIDEVAAEVIAVGRELVEAQLSPDAQALIAYQMTDFEGGAPFSCTLTHPDGRQELVRFNDPGESGSSVVGQTGTGTSRLSNHR